MAMIHLPHVHLLLEEINKVLFPLCTVVFTTATLPFVIPGKTTMSTLFCRSVTHHSRANQVKHNVAPLPLKAVAFLPSFVEPGMEAERPRVFLALSRLSLGAEGGRPLQLGSYGLGVPTVVTRAGTVWHLVPKELGDGGMAATGGNSRDTAQ